MMTSTMHGMDSLVWPGDTRWLTWRCRWAVPGNHDHTGYEDPPNVDGSRRGQAPQAEGRLRDKKQWGDWMDRGRRYTPAHSNFAALTQQLEWSIIRKMGRNGTELFKNRPSLKFGATLPGCIHTEERRAISTYVCCTRTSSTPLRSQRQMQIMASKGRVKSRGSIKAEGSEWETKEERPNTPKLPNSEMEEEGAHGAERVTVEHNPPPFRWYDQYLAKIPDEIGI